MCKCTNLENRNSHRDVENKLGYQGGEGGIDKLEDETEIYTTLYKRDVTKNFRVAQRPLFNAL